MKMILYKPVFQRIENPFEFELPQSPIYYFAQRRAVRVVPVFTTWNMDRFQKPESVYELDVTIVHNEFDTSVERFKIPANERTFQDFIDRATQRQSLNRIEEVLNKLLYFPDEDLRTKERFEDDLKIAIEKINQ